MVKELKVLSALSQVTALTRPTEIGQLVGETPLNTGKALTELGKGELAVQTDKDQNLWAVTETGPNHLEKHRQLTESVTLSQGQHRNRCHQPHRVRSNLKPSLLKQKDSGE